jgi:hypothetical protein
MSQNDFNLANQGFPSMRSDMNSALQALASNSSGATSPATTYAYQWWYDTTTDVLKMRNATNAGWIDFATFNQATGTFTITAASVSGFPALQTTVGQLSGRNLIINGSGRINQRGYVSGAATTIANQYTLDRWRVVTLGKNLALSGTAAGYTMTAPAGGVEQVIEGINIVGGTYVVNWTGTATCTVGGTARTKGEAFTLTANTDYTLRMTGGTFTNLQLELGSIATPFEQRAVSHEHSLCQRYYETGSLGIQSASQGTTLMTANFKAKKRSAPTIALTDVLASNVSSRNIINNGDTTSSLIINAVASAAGGYVIVNWSASAEL